VDVSSDVMTEVLMEIEFRAAPRPVKCSALCRSFIYKKRL